MGQRNGSIRAIAKAYGIPLYKIAERMQISEPTLYRWLREDPLPRDKEDKILAAIEEITKEG